MILSILLLACSGDDKDSASESDADTDADTDSDTDADADTDTDTDTDSDTDTDTDTDTDDTGTSVPPPTSALLVLPCPAGHGHASGSIVVEDSVGTKVGELAWKEDETRMLALALDPGDYVMTWFVSAWDKKWTSKLGPGKEPFTVTDTSYFFFDNSKCGGIAWAVLESGIDYEPDQVVVGCDAGLTALYCGGIIESEEMTPGTLLTKDPASYVATWKTGETAPAAAVELLDDVAGVRSAQPMPK
jgi:hypothetical protein